MRAKAASVRTSPSVARTAASDSGLPASVPPMPPTSESSTVTVARTRAATACGHAVGADRHPAADGLADDQEVGLEAVGRGEAAGTGTEGVRLVDEQQRAGLARQPTHGVVVAGLGQHDADVRQGRLDEDDGNVAGGQGTLERLDVVERHDLGRQRRVDRPGRCCRGVISTRPSGVSQAKVSSTEPW